MDADIASQAADLLAESAAAAFQLKGGLGVKEAVSFVGALAALLPRASPPASRSAVGAGGGGEPRSVALQPQVATRAAKRLSEMLQ